MAYNDCSSRPIQQDETAVMDLTKAINTLANKKDRQISRLYFYAANFTLNKNPLAVDKRVASSKAPISALVLRDLLMHLREVNGYPFIRFSSLLQMTQPRKLNVRCSD